ncbi:MAG: AAA family ATPase [Verrucomicrobiota bacterium]
MITQVHVKNFRGIAEETVDLGNLTVFVGRNGAGKSSFVDVIRFVRDAVTVGLDDAIVHRHGIAALRRYAPTKPYDVEIDLTIETRSWQASYGFCIASGKEGEYRVKREYCSANATDRSAHRFEREGNRIHWSGMTVHGGEDRLRGLEPISLALPSVAIFSPFFSRIRTYLRSMNFCAIFPNTLREPQKPSPLKQLTEHGDNLASILRHLRESKWFGDFKSALNKVIGGINDLRVRQIGGYLATELQHQMGGGNSAWFDLSQESDGTLRILGLLVSVYQNPRSGAFLAIEEPELTLHPGALGVLSDVLLEASTRGQLLITTQSPDLISRFSANDLRVVERSEGLTYIGPVDETQRKTVEDQLFSAGDLLRIEGLRRQTTMAL